MRLRDHRPVRGGAGAARARPPGGRERAGRGPGARERRPQRNHERHGARGRVGGVVCDVILPTPPIRAGRATVLRLFTGARDVLRPGGRVLFVARTGQGARTLARHVASLFGNVTELAKGGGFRVYAATREPAGVLKTTGPPPRD